MMASQFSSRQRTGGMVSAFCVAEARVCWSVNRGLPFHGTPPPPDAEGSQEYHQEYGAVHVPTSEPLHACPRKSPYDKNGGGRTGSPPAARRESPGADASGSPSSRTTHHPSPVTSHGCRVTRRHPDKDPAPSAAVVSRVLSSSRAASCGLWRAGVRFDVGLF